MKLELNVTEARLLLRLLHSPSTSNARAADLYYKLAMLIDAEVVKRKKKS